MIFMKFLVQLMPHLHFVHKVIATLLTASKLLCLNFKVSSAQASSAMQGLDQVEHKAETSRVEIIEVHINYSLGLILNA
jgi:hypothetical protein